MKWLVLASIVKQENNLFFTELCTVTLVCGQGHWKCFVKAWKWKENKFHAFVSLSQRRVVSFIL